MSDALNVQHCAPLVHPSSYEVHKSSEVLLLLACRVCGSTLRTGESTLLLKPMAISSCASPLLNPSSLP